MVVGAGLDDAAPTGREDFAHGSDGGVRRSIGPGCLAAGSFTRSRPLSARESTAKMRNRTDLSGSDRTMLEELIADLEDALGTPRIGPW